MLWFAETLVSFHVSHTDGHNGMSVMESLARRGDSPPYHVHTTEDEVFHVLEGELVVCMDGALRTLTAGELMLAPRGVPHTYCVVSEQARWLVTTTHGDFERFVRAASRPAERLELPPAGGPPTPEHAAAFAALALEHRIELIGPPLDERTALAA